MTSLSFFCPCVPPTTTHHHKKIIRIGRFTRIGDRPELQQAKAMLEELLVKHQPHEPLRGAVRLELSFTWPWLAGHPKRLRALSFIPRTTKPDCSNLAKTIEDRLAALRFIENDANVVDLRVSKWFGDVPGIAVKVSTVGESGGLPLLIERPSLHGLFSEAASS